MGPCPFGRYFAQIKGVHSRILRRIKVFLHNNGQKNVFVAEYFLLALKRYTVVFKRSDRSIWSGDTMGGFICNMRGRWS